jgi:sugar lactone lactonase YvrE
MAAKFNSLLFSALLIAGCEINLQTTTGDPDFGIKTRPTYSEKVNFAGLDKEFLPFKTKKLTANYFQRSLINLIGSDNGIANGSKIVKLLDFARYKTETVIPFKAMAATYPDLYTTLTGVIAVINRRSISTPFDEFIENANPVGFTENSGIVTTLAGTNPGPSDGTGTEAQFTDPWGVAVDSSGNVFVADDGNDLIRKITPEGVVTTVAGSGARGDSDGTGTEATFNRPIGIAVNNSTGTLYVVDYNDNKLRMITSGGVVSTLAGSGAKASVDGTGTGASFAAPFGIALDSSGIIYVSDREGYKIRKVTQDGVVTTIAGNDSPGSADGNGTLAQFAILGGIALDAAGNMYIADYSNSLIRKMDKNYEVTTIPNTQVNGPNGVAIDHAKNVYIADYGNNRIRKITPAGVVSTLAGNGEKVSFDGTGLSAKFCGPVSIAAGNSGILYVAEFEGNRIRKIE